MLGGGRGGGGGGGGGGEVGEAGEVGADWSGWSMPVSPILAPPEKANRCGLRSEWLALILSMFCLWWLGSASHAQGAARARLPEEDLVTALTAASRRKTAL